MIFKKFFLELDKSKSIISQALTHLAEQESINKNYVSNPNSNESHHRISITTKELKINKAILAEGLELFEI